MKTTLKTKIKRFFLAKSLRANQNTMQYVMDERLALKVLETYTEQQNKVLRLKILETYIMGRNK